MRTLKVIIERRKEFSKRMVDSFKKAIDIKTVSGEISMTKDTIVFESLEDFSRFLTPERKRLLEVIKKNKPNSIKELSQLLRRDYKNVNVDTNMLAGIGFVELRKDKNRIKPRVIYDEIEVKIHVSGSKDRKIPA